MSAMSPFREDVELAEPMEIAPRANEHDFEEDETWRIAEADETPFAEAAEVDADAEVWWEGEDFHLGDAEEEAWHPILSMFPVPRAVLDALSSGLAPVAVGLAVGAGYKDPNQLTNIVFYFRHPEMIGRKIQADQRDLAAEWIAIRDRIVKPALQSLPSQPSTGAAGGAGVVTGTASGVPPAAADRIPSSGLRWDGATDEMLAFMRAVYDRAVENSKRPERRGEGPRVFVPSLRREELDKHEGHWGRIDTIRAVAELLKAARAELAAENPRARIGIVSAYRSADHQYLLWQGRDRKGRRKKSGGFPTYYEWMVKGKLRRGDYGPKAVETMAAEIGGWIAAPGYSNHQDGRAIDFGYSESGGSLGTVKKGDWFHRWLGGNAVINHGFHPYWKEAWHWTYKGMPKGSSEIWASEDTTPAIRANRIEVPRVPLLARHRGNAPDLILRWNDMPSAPAELDVVVHLHGFWYSGLRLGRHIEPVSGLDLAPVKGADGTGRSRPTLTVLPRGHNTGSKQKNGPYNAYVFPALVKKEGLTDLVRFAVDRFAAEVGRAAPRVGRLIVTAHSGGGKALLEILRHHDPHQVHVFDALYWPAEPLAEWARRRIRRDRAAVQAAPSAVAEYMATQGGALRVFYMDRTKRGTRPQSLALRETIASELGDGLEKWYRVEASRYDHFQIPRLYGRRVLADASADVPDAYVEQVGRRKELEVGFDELEDVFGDEELSGLFRADELEDEDFAELSAPPMNALREPISRARRTEALEPEIESEWDSEVVWTHDEEDGDFDEIEYELDEEDELVGAAPEELDELDFGAEDLWELEETDESRESGEVELGEAEAFFEELYSPELTFEEETPTAVTFPSGETLRVVPGPTGPGEEHYDPNGSGNPLLDTSASVRSRRVSTSFTVSELARSGGSTFDTARIDPKLVESLQRLRDHVGKPVRVTSGYRPYLYNVDLYANKYKKKPTLSRHSSGQAADVKIGGMTGMEIAKTAIDVLGPEVAVGIGGDYAHLDVRGKSARWTYFTDKDENERAVAEIDAYRRSRAGGGLRRSSRAQEDRS